MPSSAALASLPSDYVEADRGYSLRNLAICFIVAETLCVGLRFLSKYIGNKSFALDDGLIIPAWLCAIGTCISAIIAVDHGGVGRHLVVDVFENPKSLVLFAKVVAAQPFIYDVACACPRLAILAIYLNVFPNRRERIACYTVMGLIISHGLSLLIVGSVSCIPIAKSWDARIQGSCINIAAFYRWGTMPNVIIDGLMLALPLPAILNLQMSRHVKLGLTITFLTGSLGMVTAIMRTYYFFTIAVFSDPTWTAAQVMTWSIIEPGVYVIAACLPCYRPLLKLLFSGKGTNQPHNSGKNGNRHFIMNSFISKRRAGGAVKPLPLASVAEGDEIGLRLQVSCDDFSQRTRSVDGMGSAVRIERIDHDPTHLV